ncbi:MAG: VCBS repeat-containing protein [Caldilineaceae bacterium]
MRRCNPIVRTISSCLLTAMVLLSAGLPGASRQALAAPQLDNNEEIVYLTADKQIQVLDTLQTGGATQIQWNSGDDKGYFDFTLGDVNNDGDKEIIGIKDNGGAGLLVVYDPVVSNGPSDGSINGVPWRKLATINLLGNPSAVAAGNFDPAVNGDEILVVYAIPGGSRLEVYHGNQVNHDGTLWPRFIPAEGSVTTIDFNYVWRDASVADVIAGGPQEVVLSSSDANKFRVYRFDAGFVGLCAREDLDINDVAAGQWSAGGGAEIGVVRSFPNDPTFIKDRFLMFSCNTGTGQVDDVNIGEQRFRDPFALTAADVNGDGADEFFMLRNLPNEQASTGAHILGRKNGGGIDFEVNLGGNFYQSITSGDVDGDGKDEVVIMRDNDIRIYTDPEIGADAKNRWIPNPVATNQYAVEVGDLDKNGFQAGYLLTSDKSSLSATVSAGDKLTDAGIFTVKLNTDAISLQHNEPTIEGMPAGVVFNFRAFQDNTPGFTPTTYIFDIDATGATTPQPNTPYNGAIAISSNDPAVKNVLRIPFSLTLTYAQLNVTPAAVYLAYYPCNNSSTQVQTFANQVKIEGTPGVTFEVIGGSSRTNDVTAASPDLLPKWLGISPESGKVGDSLSLSVDPTQWPSKQYEEATVILQGDAKTGSQLKQFKVGVICAKSRTLLPIVAR